MKFYLVCTVPRLGFRMTALGDSMDVADACFAYETAIEGGKKKIYIIKKICAVWMQKPLDVSEAATKDVLKNDLLEKKLHIAALQYYFQ